MRVPQHLQKLVEEGFAKVAADADHHLILGHREAIYFAFGPHLFEEGNFDRSGYVRRVTLAMQAVRHVLPMWQKAWPENGIVQELLDKVRRLISQDLSEQEREDLTDETEGYWEEVTELTDRTRNIAGVVGIAAVRMYSLAIWDGFLADEEMDPNRKDSDDFMINDVHFYVATAYADGPPYEIALAPESSASKRQEFWEWWLTEAVPAAWEAA